MKSLYIVCSILLASSLAPAQLYLTSTVAGTPPTSGDSGDGAAATAALLANPLCVALDSKGNYYISDYKNHVIREVSASTGVISTVAGTGTPGFSGDGQPATAAQFSAASGLALDAAGNLYIADGPNARVRMVDTHGNMRTFAGNGSYGDVGDGGPAANATLFYPVGVAVDHAGNVYIADEGNGTVRKVTTDGNISTIAGIDIVGFGLFNGDGGSARNATLSLPYAVAVDETGNVFIDDVGTGSIRKIGLDGNINTFVPNVSTASLAADPAGNLYYADYRNSTINMVLPNGTVAIVAGNGTGGYSGDGGPGIAAAFHAPYSVALDSSSNIYVADYNNDAIRLLTRLPSSGVLVANGASGVEYSSPGVQLPVAPGEIVTVFGTNIGAPSAATAQPDANGIFETQLAGAMVTFDGIPAPILATSPSQVTAIAPYGLTGAASAATAALNGQMAGSRGRIVADASSANVSTVVVTYQGRTTATTTVPVGSASPGIFTASSTGYPGGLAVLNTDGTVNTTGNAAAEASTITLFVTGEGQTNPAGVNGLVSGSSNLPVPLLPVTVTIGGNTATVVSATEASGYVAGIMQVKVTLPTAVVTNSYVPVTVQVGNAVSRSVNIAVK